jgi:hypothetical protein
MEDYTPGRTCIIMQAAGWSHTIFHIIMQLARARRLLKIHPWHSISAEGNMDARHQSIGRLW